MSSAAEDRQLHAGDAVPRLELSSIDGTPVVVPDDGGRLTHLQLRRFAGCPFCNLHLRSVATRIGEIEDANVREVVVFHSTVKELRKYEADLPFPVVADPERELYRRFGVEHTVRSVLSLGALRSMLPGILGAVRTAGSRRGAVAPLAPTGGNFGLPADLLVAPDGTVVAAKYGTHAYDQWTVDELLAEAASVAAPA